MNIKITYNWLKDHLDTDADPYEIQKYLSLCGPSVERVEKIDDDYVFDIEITSNRVDCASVMGIARECQAILPQFGKKAELKKIEYREPVLGVGTKILPLTIEDPDNLVNKILAIIFDSVIVKQSPEYMQKRLEMCDIRSLNNLIDITNYVMLEVGHPTHVFDYDRIETGKLIFRKALPNEKIVTLDDKTFSLCEDDVVIDDGTGRIIDLPGIMGTKNSVITDDTQRVIFFIENNHPKIIRKTSMKYGIRSLAATINEKEPDNKLAYDALIQGSVMFIELAQGTIASEIYDIHDKKTQSRTLKIDNHHIASLMGVNIKPQDTASILKRLEFDVYQNGDTLKVTVPTFRSKDISIEEDIIEEVARIYGYHTLPSNLQTLQFIEQPHDKAQLQLYELKTKYFLKHHGFNESYNYSVISAETIKNYLLEKKNHLKLSNTISNEIEFMRTSLVPSLLKNISENQGRTEYFQLFEIASVYLKKDLQLPDERKKLVLAVTTDFYSLKGCVESLFAEFHIPFSFRPSQNIAQLSPHIQAEILSENKVIGTIGKVMPEIAHNFNITHDIYVCDIDFEQFTQNIRSTPMYSPINQYAVIKLDLTVQKQHTYSSLVEIMMKASDLLQKIEYISSFENKITVRCYFSDTSKNLTEEEAKNELEKIKSVLSHEDHFKS